MELLRNGKPKTIDNMRARLAFLVDAYGKTLAYRGEPITPDQVRDDQLPAALRLMEDVEDTWYWSLLDKSP